LNPPEVGAHSYISAQLISAPPGRSWPHRVRSSKSKSKLEATKKSRNVEFDLLAPKAESVFWAGNFNQWNLSSHPLILNNEGVWRISIPLSPGRYEYRFFVDGEWQNDPACSSVVENPFGTSNCVKIVE